MRNLRNKVLFKKYSSVRYRGAFYRGTFMMPWIIFFHNILNAHGCWKRLTMYLLVQSLKKNFSCSVLLLLYTDYLIISINSTTITAYNELKW